MAKTSTGTPRKRAVAAKKAAAPRGRTKNAANNTTRGRGKAARGSGS